MRSWLSILFVTSLFFPITLNAEVPIEELEIEALRCGGGCVPLKFVPTLHVYQDLCGDNTEYNFEQMGSICKVVVNSPICKEVPDNQRLNCEDIKDVSQVRDTWSFLKGCGEGVWTSTKNFLSFIWETMKWVWGNATDSKVRTETTDKADEYADAIKLYLHTEYEKAYERSSPPLRNLEAVRLMGGKIALLIFDRIKELIAQEYQLLGCLNFEAQSNTICTLIGELVVPPAALLSLIKYGAKAAKQFPSVERALSNLKNSVRKIVPQNNSRRIAEAEKAIDHDLTPNERQALIKAHEFGNGAKGENGKPAHLGNYTVSQLKGKAKILKNAGFTQDQIRKLMENGVVGLSKNEAQSFMSRVRTLFRENPPKATPQNVPSPQKNNPSFADEVLPSHGTPVAIPRSGGGLSNAHITEHLGTHIRVAFQDTDGAWKTKVVKADSLYNPLEVDHIKLGDKVSFPRTAGGKSNGKVTGIDKDGRVRVEFVDEKGQSVYKKVPAHRIEPSLPLSDGLPSAVVQRGLTPRDGVRVRNYGHVKVGEFFRDSGNRIFTVAEVTVDGKVSHRVFYRSNSQSVFRLLPARNKRIPSHPGYDKGMDENFLTAPPELQAFLSERLKNSDDINRLIEMDPEKLEGIIRVNRSKEDWLAYSRSDDYVDERFVHVNKVLENTPQSYADEFGRHFAHPTEVRISDPKLQPNYSRQVQTYKISSPAYGEVRAYVYKSKDGSLEYTLLRDSKNRVWFGDVGYAGGVLTSHGLRSNAIDAEELMMPLWEYSTQIPTKFTRGEVNPLYPEYESSWNYIKGIPEIQRWYRDNGVAMPD